LIGESAARHGIALEQSITSKPSRRRRRRRIRKQDKDEPVKYGVHMSPAATLYE
jgi:hypothetical protein